MSIFKSIGFGKKTKAPEVTEQQSSEPTEPKLVLHADTKQMDAEVREMYRDAREAALDAEDEARESPKREFTIGRPFALGFTVTLGVLVALVVGDMVGQLSTILMYVVAALFIALGLDPVVRWLERHGVRRPLGIGIVFVGFILIIGGILAIVIPMIGNQVAQLVQSAPEIVRNLTNEQWYKDVNDRFGEFVDFNSILKMGQDFIGKPSNWASVAGGVWQAGIGIANGLTAGLIVLILSLYFLSSLRTIKRGFYSIVPRSGRAKVIDITEQVTKSVGGYVNGMVVLALVNATLGFIMMTIVGVPFAGLVAVGVFLLALIPLIGSVLATVLVTAIALFNSPITALVAAIYYLIYMQLESYLLTPRIMNRVVSVPGSLVVIGALAGGTLLGLLGALIAIPVTAAVLMIIKQVWVPRQNAR
ncbi:putative transport protein [Leucobacter aridicollis]|uniref:Putative PurR-regulated permease PerM n=1 Tax=Leucobacter aridicollis TaxID=283878 RepID=A0A852QTT1_9MICO|nr:AI-2E family transporter [Leucobacter aridicollis]MBL3682240.1 AI-2E family transporter [Leucobacter aridicollis]MCS3426366.1 putative PurR-regulated permease PerM [Leucobacter aridicollis]NYD25653.1 putative PurR-regulated permease PerM [Leucobacter aridicollis]RKQ89476.1 putative PurR-regulated permease PerM [Mycolicibacterium mucogenicum 261Sha1.1M5]